MNAATHIQTVVSRTRTFLQATTPGHYLVRVNLPTATLEIPPLYEFDLDRQLTEYFDWQLKAARLVWRAKAELDDDTIACICPRFGIAEHSAWLGMNVQFQERTCLPIPIIDSLADVKHLRLSETTKWFQYMQRGYEYLRQQQQGDFVLAVRGTMMPMDLANALRGDEIFTDFLLQPELAHALMQFLVKGIQWYYGRLRNWADQIEGGQVFIFHDGWLGPNYLAHVSNDAALLCSMSVYEEFGFPYETALSQSYGGVLYHVHNEKMQFVPKVAQLPNLKLLEVSCDPKTVTPIENLPHILAQTGSANLLLEATSDQVRRRLEELKERNVFFNVQCTDQADAADIIQFVRRHTKS